MARDSLQALHRRRLRHQDIRAPNLVFNEEVGVMMIDFEQTEVLAPQRQPLTPIVPNKRAQTGETKHGKQVTKVATRRDKFSREVAQLEAIFA